MTTTEEYMQWAAMIVELSIYNVAMDQGLEYKKLLKAVVDTINFEQPLLPE